MKWIPISERLPEKDGWYLWWDGHYYSDQYYIVGNSGHHYTHWLEITGPDDYCEWKYDDYYGCYDRTCCEEPFYLSNDEPLPKNNIHHCPNCGRPIKETKP